MKRPKRQTPRSLDELRATCVWAALGDCEGKCHCAEAIAQRETEEQAAAEALANSRRNVADQLAKATLSSPAAVWRDADAVVGA